MVIGEHINLRVKMRDPLCIYVCIYVCMFVSTLRIVNKFLDYIFSVIRSRSEKTTLIGNKV